MSTKHFDLPVNDVDDTSGNQNIGDGDTSRVDEDGSVDNRNCDALSVDSLQSGVSQDAAVSNSALDDVVCQNAAECLSAEVRKSRSDSLESLV